MIFACLGANGGTAREIIALLLQLDAHQVPVTEVRCIIRNAEDPLRKPPIHHDLFALVGSDSRLKIVSGDCTNADSVVNALKNVQIVFFCACGSREGYQALAGVDDRSLDIVATAGKIFFLRCIFE